MNENVVSDIIIYNLRVNRISAKNALKDTSVFPNLLSKEALGLLDTLNSSSLLSDKSRNEICETVVNTSEENIPLDRIALLQLINLTKQMAQPPQSGNHRRAHRLCGGHEHRQPLYRRVQTGQSVARHTSAP